ncbi:hypothetical protein BaRGS_00035752 [Batillaria attramentaria]|uniref:G-protein coupled receptors family 1 profile domain-containing protein n=1 Tax=Batillaria attramentaria TaxID=370345 RepID=A0ABD0JDN5_9CAEN
MCQTDSSNMNSSDAYEWEKHMLELTIVLTIYGIVGFVGNSLILVVYMRRKTKLSHSTYVCTLATVDLIVCCVIIPYTIAYERRIICFDVICRGLEILRHTLVMSSSEILCAIAVERYFSVFRPMRIQTAGRARTAIIIVFANSIIIAIPSVTVFTVTTKSQETSNQNASVANTTEVTSQHAHAYCQFTRDIVSEMWALSYQLLLVLQFFLSVAVMVVIYIKVYIEIWRRARWRNRISGISRTADSFKSREGDSVNPARDSRAVFSLKCSQLSPPFDSRGKRPSPAPQSMMQLQVASLDSTRMNGFAAGGDEGPGNGTLAPSSGVARLQIPSSGRRKDMDTAEVHLQNGDGKEEVNRVRFELEGATNDNTTAVQHNPTVTSSAIATTTASAPSRQQQHNQRKAGTMLFICTLIYIVTWLPFWMDVFGLTDNLVFRYTFLLGHVTNPLVYSAVNAKVRAEVRRTLLCL